MSKTASLPNTRRALMRLGLPAATAVRIARDYARGDEQARQVVKVAIAAALTVLITVGPAGSQTVAVTSGSSSFQPAARGGGTWSFRTETAVGRFSLSRGSVDAENNWNATPDAWKRTVVIGGRPRVIAVTPCGAVHVDFLDGRYAKAVCP
jgi:hypothetical protein